MRGVPFQAGLYALTLVTSCSKRPRARERAGQWRMACWKNSGSSPQRGEVGSGFSSNKDGWAAR